MLLRIITIIGLALLLWLMFFATAGSLKKLKAEISPYYPFDRFFPRSGTWSVGYFLIAILFLGILMFLLAKGGFYLGPA